MKTNTAIAIVNKSVTPPPRKAEIIEALALRQRQLQQEALAKHKAATLVAEKEFRASIAEDLATVPKSVVEMNEPDYRSAYKDGARHLVSVYQRIEYKPSAKSVRLYAAWRKLYDMGVCVEDLSVIKRRLRESAAGHTQGDRVKALLDSPESVKALDAMLKSLCSS